MPKYTVTVQHLVTQLFEKTITAKDPEAAQEKVEALLGDDADKHITEKKGWTLNDLTCDDEWTVDSVDEE